MRVGLQYIVPMAEGADSVRERYEEAFNDLKWADSRGFHAFWITEHHFSNYSVTSSPLLILSKAAQVAPTLRLGTSILVLPIWDPVRLVADVSTLDVLTSGRVELGIGRGYQPHEIRGFGQDPDKLRERFEEAVDLILQLFNQPDRTFKGKHYHVDVPVTVLPRPYQKPHPPIWMASSSPESVRYAAKMGFNFMTPTAWTKTELGVQRDFIEQCILEFGTHWKGRQYEANRFIYCGDDEEGVTKALDACSWQLSLAGDLRKGSVPNRGINPPPTDQVFTNEVMRQRLIYGTPDQIVQQLEGLADSGITYILAQFRFGHLPANLAVTSMHRFAAEVLPRLGAIKSRPLMTQNVETV